jgi:hypothetical protein
MMRRNLIRMGFAAMVGVTLAGCGGDEPTAGEATAEQLDIIKKNEPSNAPPSPMTKNIRADGAVNSLGAQ